MPIGPWNTQGLIVAIPLHSLVRSAYIEELRASGFPVLFIGSGETGPTISANNAAGITQAVAHLAGHGRRKLAFIAGSADDLTGDSGKRLQAFQSACRQFGLEQDPRRVLYGRHVYDGGFAAVAQLLQSGADFDALIASNDESAIGAMDALKQAGLRIPQDVAVIGFDNRLEGAVQQPGLTSIHVPLFDMGYRAAQELWRHLTQGSALSEIYQVDAQLVVRQSCGCGMPSLLDNVHLPSKSTSLGEEIGDYIRQQIYDLEETEIFALSHALSQTFERSLTEMMHRFFASPLPIFLTALLSLAMMPMSGKRRFPFCQKARPGARAQPWLKPCSMKPVLQLARACSAITANTCWMNAGRSAA